MSILPIMVYGNGDVFREYFNAIVTSFGTSDFNTLIKIAILLAGVTVIYSFMMQRDLMVLVKWFGLYYMAVFVLFTPKISVEIIDRVNQGHVYKVDNVPLGLGVLASYTSTIGDALTQLTEMNFSTPNDLRYRETGLVFASRLVTEANQFEITDPDFDRNLQSYISQCVFYDIMLHRYSMNDLISTANVWDFVSSHTSPARAFIYNQEVTVCREGAALLTKDWTSAIDDAMHQYANRLFPSQKNAKAALLKYLPISYGYLTKLSDTANQIMQQHLMSNALQRGVLRMNGTLNASAAMESYAYTRAQEQKRLTNKTLSDMAAYWLPLMKNAFEAIMYGSFIFIVLLSVFPFGWMVLKHYVFTLLWIQLWAPLYAVINLLVSYYAEVNSMAAVNGALSMKVMSGLGQLNADIAGLAGYLTLSVPFLSAGLARGMAGTFTQLSQYIGGVTQSTGSAGAQEAVTGNMSLGNTNFANHSAFNTNANHYDTSGRFSSGMFTGQMPGGSLLSVMPDGSLVMNSSGAISNTGTNINLAESVRTARLKQADQAYTHLKNQSQSYGESFASGMRDVYEFSKHVSHAESGSEGWNMSTSTGTSEAINAMVRQTQKFANDHHVSFDVAQRALMAAYMDGRVEGKVGFNILGTGVSGSAGLGGKIETDKSSSISNRALFADAKDFIKDSGYSKNVDTVERAVHDHGIRSSDDKGTRLLENAAASFDRAESARKEVAHSYQEAQSYRDAATSAHENAWSVSQNLAQPFVEWIADQPGSNGKGRIGMHQSEHILRNDPLLAARYAEQFAEYYTKNTPSQWDTKTFAASKEGVQSSYSHNHPELKDKAKIEKNYKQQHQTISDKGRDLSMDKVIDSAPKTKTEQLIDHNKQFIKDEKKAIEQQGQKIMQTIHDQGGSIQ